MLLDFIHGPVGCPDQLVRAFHTLEIIFLKRADSHADRGGELEVSVIKNARFHSRANAFGNELGLAMTRAGHENDKLLAPETDQDVLAPAETLEQHGHIPKQSVAGEVAVSVIDLLEVIQVDEEAGER